MSCARSVLRSVLLLCLVCRYVVHCAVPNNTDKEIKVTLSGTGDRVSVGSESVLHEADYKEYEEFESYDEDLSGYDVEDSIRVQAVVNPANGVLPVTTVEKKKTEKKKKGKRNKNGPCQTKYKGFCVHGKCRYLKRADEVSCKCHENYFGERCTEQYLKTETTNPSDMTTTILVVVVVLSTLSITAIVIAIIVHRRKYSSYDCEAEETKRLGQENGSEDV
ncbi:Epidermal growth factor-like domain [Pristimantis euphronides]